MGKTCSSGGYSVQLAHAGRMSPATAGDRSGDVIIISASSAPLQLGMAGRTKGYDIRQFCMQVIGGSLIL